MLVRPIEYDSAEYRLALEMRRRLLREPLGLPLSAEDTAGEDAQHHFGIFDDAGELIGGVIGKPDPNEAAAVRIRQMVIAEEHRGGGLGRRLLIEAEELLAQRGFRKLILFARPEATGFYAKCGYTATGVEEDLIGLKHCEMRKTGAA